MSEREGIHDVQIVRVEHGAHSASRDAVAVERALEVRLGGAPFAVIMRTPGADRDLAAGFLFSEGVVADREDVVVIESRVDTDVVDVTISEARAAVVNHERLMPRQVTMNSSCGMCGRQTLESTEMTAPRLDDRWTISTRLVSSLPSRLLTLQATFAQTGGLHAAALVTTTGDVAESAEDVGRHNAVDKIVGRRFLAGDLPLSEHMLFVSGRTSFEIVQKAWLAGVSVVAAVSAPSSLAIELAHTAGITLIGFVRGDRFNIYTHPERVVA